MNIMQPTQIVYSSTSINITCQAFICLSQILFPFIKSPNCNRLIYHVLFPLDSSAVSLHLPTNILAILSSLNHPIYLLQSPYISFSTLYHHLTSPIPLMSLSTFIYISCYLSYISPSIHFSQSIPTPLSPLYLSHPAYLLQFISICCVSIAEHYTHWQIYNSLSLSLSHSLYGMD